MDKNFKQAIKSLTATQTRMAIILLRQNGKESALKFIKGVTTNKIQQDAELEINKWHWMRIKPRTSELNVIGQEKHESKNERQSC